MMDTSGSVKVVIFDMDDGWVELHMEDRPGGLVGREREPTDLRAGLLPKCKKTSQELRMLSSVTINCQVTKIVMNSGSQLSVL